MCALLVTKQLLDLDCFDLIDLLNVCVDESSNVWASKNRKIKNLHRANTKYAYIDRMIKAKK